MDNRCSGTRSIPEGLRQNVFRPAFFRVDCACLVPAPGREANFPLPPTDPRPDNSDARQSVLADSRRSVRCCARGEPGRFCGRDRLPAPGRCRPGGGLRRIARYSIRRECLDHMIVFGEAHLRRILGRYAAYYNESRIHRSLDKEAPFHRAIERFGDITSQPVLGGLHHQYCRI
jgi:hypothetical protein